LSEEEHQLRKELKSRVLGLAAIERLRKRQASRPIWLKEGDACTWFFHLKANGRSRKNFISCLKNGDGILEWSHDQKEQTMCNYAKNLLGARLQCEEAINWDLLEMP
jgi:hypothetical protein